MRAKPGRCDRCRETALVWEVWLCTDCLNTFAGRDLRGPVGKWWKKLLLAR